MKVPHGQVSVPTIAHLGMSGRRNLGDSLLAHASGEESLNVSYESESKSTRKGIVNSRNIGVSLSGSVDSGKQYGGGDMSPPGGATGGKGQRSYGAKGGGRGKSLFVIKYENTK